MSAAAWPRRAAASTAARSSAWAAFGCRGTPLGAPPRRPSASPRPCGRRCRGTARGGRGRCCRTRPREARPQGLREPESCDFRLSRRPRVPQPAVGRLASWVRESRVPLGACGVSALVLVSSRGRRLRRREPAVSRGAASTTTTATEPTCPPALARGWQKLADQIEAAVYCPSWLPDPLVGRIGGQWEGIHS